MTMKKCIVCGKNFEAKGRDICCSRECSRERYISYNKKYYQKNKEQMKEYYKRYYQENKEKMLEYRKKYY